MRTKSFQTALKAGASLAILASAANAAAQDSDAGDDLFTLEEITVTAQKREQSQQDVPITLNAFSADFLETVAAETMRDLNAYTPGLEVTGVTQPRFKVRGVVTSDFGVGTDPAVGVFIDGIYSSRSGSAVVFFSDLDRVEVLKGPQGTLFGRNTAAGAISIHTKRPVMDDFEGRVKLRAGRFGKQQFDGMLNVPLGNGFAMRGNFLVNHRNGYAEDAITGEDYGRQDNVTGRVQLRWEPSDNTAVNLSYEFDHTDQDEEKPKVSMSAGTLRWHPDAETVGDLGIGFSSFFTLVAPSLGLPFTADTPLSQLDAVPLSAVYASLAPFGYTPANSSAEWDFFSNASSVGGTDPMGPVASDIGSGHEKRNLDGIALNITHDFEWATLTSITSFKKFNSNNLEDNDGQQDPRFYLDTENIERNESFSHEFRLNGVSDRLTWMVGASYWHEKAEQSSEVNATTDSIDTTLYNIGATSGILLGNLDFSDGINTTCETLFFDSLGGPVAFSQVPFECIDPSIAALGLAGLSFESLANMALTSFSGRKWTETMSNEGTFKAFAAYADVSFAVTDVFNLHAGVRYTRDKKTWSWFHGARELEDAEQLDIPGVVNLDELNYAILGDIVYAGNVDFERSDSWENVSPRFAFDYHISDDLMVYGSYALGYKAGGYNGQEVNSFFENEKVWNLEAGMKSQWMEDRVRFNMALWKYEYNDRQSISLEDIDDSGIPRYVTRTSDTSGKGIDVELLWAPTAGLRFFANGGYQDIICAANCGRSEEGDPTGEPTTRISFGADYNIPMGDDKGSISLHANHSYTSAQRENGACREDGTCGVVFWEGVSWATGEAQNFTNVRITWTNADEDFSLSFFGNNIFNNRYNGGAGGIGVDTMGAAEGSPTLPGIWGIDLTKHF